MATSDSPAFQFYPKDFLTSERQIGMSATEAGIYMRLICHCWLSTTLPNIPRILAKMAGVSDEEFSSGWPVVRECFYINPQGRLQHARLDKEREKQETFRQEQSRKGQLGAEARWPRPSSGHATAIAEGMAGDGSSSSSSSSSPISDLHLQSPISGSQGSINKLVREGAPHTTSEPKNLPAAPSKPKNGNGHPPTTARSKRPIFSGQRLTVFEWMLDDCAKTLGPLTDAFHLDEWFFALDAELVKTAIVIQKRDGGVWLQAQLVAEAQRRGLPIAVAAPPPSKRTAQLAHTIATIAREEAEKRRRQS